MVAFLGGLVVALMFIISGMWATIHRKQARINELEALHAPPTSPPWSVIRAREESLDRVTEPSLPPLFEMEGNDEPTKVCRIHP